MRVGILGCGYTGRRLAQRLRRHGHEVRGAVRTEPSRATLEAMGIAAWLVPPDALVAPAPFSAGLDALVHLAPPPPPEEVEREVRALRDACDAPRWIYGSTTGAFGRVDGWIDERTPSGPLSGRGRLRANYEDQLRAAAVPVRVVRIAGIYGPGRTIIDALERGSLLFEGGPPTSRIHVDDLARILEAMLSEDAPDTIIACDEEPAPTLEVARYARALRGEPEPEVVDLETAKARMSPAAIEMRLGGRRCRSIHRPGLVGALLYPTYREGTRAALIEDGRLTSGP